tara:strand:- start:110 stop:277 length:168 start_codon:yes stop_codon:yes gene_type:complete
MDGQGRAAVQTGGMTGEGKEIHWRINNAIPYDNHAVLLQSTRWNIIVSAEMSSER